MEAGGQGKGIPGSYREQLDLSNEAIKWLDQFFQNNPDIEFSLTMTKDADGKWATIPIPTWVQDGTVTPDDFVSACSDYLNTKAGVAGEDKSYLSSTVNTGDKASITIRRDPTVNRPSES